MASWLSKVSGGVWGSHGASVSVAGLHPDSYEEQQQKQRQHLTSRECCQVRCSVSVLHALVSVSNISVRLSESHRLYKHLLPFFCMSEINSITVFQGANFYLGTSQVHFRFLCVLNFVTHLSYF